MNFKKKLEIALDEKSDKIELEIDPEVKKIANEDTNCVMLD